MDSYLGGTFFDFMRSWTRLIFPRTSPENFSKLLHTFSKMRHNPLKTPETFPLVFALAILDNFVPNF